MSPIRADVAPVDPAALSSHEVVDATGCSYRQLDFWCVTGRVRPLNAARPGTGNDRRFGPSDVQVIRLAVQLLTFGFNLDQAIGFARQLTESGKGLVLAAADGVHLVLYTDVTS